MATCFLNNVYCCYLPAHCSHGLQPLDNGVFNVSKAAYRKELQKLTSLTDSAPVDKVNFIKAYAQAREVGMTKKNILSGWRVTGNWPISRRKALMHPEIQSDKKETTPASDGPKFCVTSISEWPSIGGGPRCALAQPQKGKLPPLQLKPHLLTPESPVLAAISPCLT
jgi:hypothetical protein